MDSCCRSVRRVLELSKFHWLDGWKAHYDKTANKNSGFYFFNYKGNFRIVLLALVDENYRFIYVNVGYNTRISDGGVLWASSLSYALHKDILRISAPKSPSDYDTALLYVIAADDAFPMQGNMMKPYQNRGLSKEKHIFTY